MRYFVVLFLIECDAENGFAASRRFFAACIKHRKMQCISDAGRFPACRGCFGRMEGSSDRSGRQTGPCVFLNMGNLESIGGFDL